MMLAVRDGLALSCRIAGQGAPLILLHGFMGSSGSWGELMPALARRYRVIALDLLGHGASSKPHDPARYAIAEIVRDLVDALEALGLERAQLLGYSMGGRVALACSVLAPERISRLVLESSSPGLKSDAERAARRAEDEARARRLEQEGITPFVDAWEQLPLFASQRRLPEALRQRLRAQRLANDPLALAACLRGLGTGAQPSFWEALPSLRQPTTLICGALDAKFVAINRDMQQRIPHAKLACIADAGHAVHLEAPAAWLACL